MPPLSGSQERRLRGAPGADPRAAKLGERDGGERGTTESLDGRKEEGEGRREGRGDGESFSPAQSVNFNGNPRLK